MEDISKYCAVVEEGMKIVGVNAESHRSPIEGQWDLQTKEIQVWVDIVPVEEENKVYFQALCPMCQVPEEDTENFYKELLDLNYVFVGAVFSTYKHGVYMKYMRDASLVTADEVADTLRRIWYYGPMFIKQFSENFKLSHIAFKDEDNG